MHTPGPWTIGYGGMEGDTSATITSPHAQYFIAQLDPPGYNQANARLIAAAPLMLAVLQEIEEHGTDDWQARLKTVRAAIAAATH